jgi:membrane-associated phospholipid phosphatase
MESLREFGLPLIQALQSISWLEWPMKVISWLGSEAFFLLFIACLYWCISPRLGLRVALILLLSTSLNYGLKLGFASPRPYWDNPQIRGYELAPSFGLPSAHAQNAVAVWGEVAGLSNRRWLTGVAVGLMVFIGLSRLYLGVHFLLDVLVGWAIGLAILRLFNRLALPVRRRVQGVGGGTQLGLALATSLLLLLPSLLLVAVLDPADLPAAWLDPGLTQGGLQPHPLSLEIPVSAAGTWLGFVAGALWLNKRFRFHPQGRLGRRITQYAIGIGVALIIWAGLGALFPEGRTLIAYALRYLRYVLLGGWIAAGAPLLFRQLPRK